MPTTIQNSELGQKTSGILYCEVVAVIVQFEQTSRVASLLAEDFRNRILNYNRYMQGEKSVFHILYEQTEYMQSFLYLNQPPTIILRHRKENLKKCSLTGLENREDMQFFTYPKDHLPDLSGHVLLAMDGPCLSEKDRDKGLFLIDGTWKYAEKMDNFVAAGQTVVKRSLPSGWLTAYPRKQDDCPDPEQGLASIEALFAAYHILGRSTEGLFDNYYWKDLFIERNNKLISFNCSK